MLYWEHQSRFTSHVSSSDLPIQPRLCCLPLPIDCPRRHAHYLGCFFHRQPAEETQLDHPAFFCVDSFEPIERLVEREQVHITLRRGSYPLFKCDPISAATTLCGTPTTRMANENSPHHLRCNPQKLRTVLPLHLMLTNEAKINLIHQRSRLQGVTGALATESPHRLAMQLIVNDREQFLERFRVALSTHRQPLRDITARGNRLWLMGVVHLSERTLVNPSLHSRH